MQVSVKVDASGYLTVALLILTLPLKWILAAMIAAGFHELCHILVILLTGGKIYSIRIGSCGTILEYSPLTLGKAFFCALAGPMGSLFLLCFCRTIPRIAFCAGVQGIFNLLPLFPLDGGQMLQCCIRQLLPEKTADSVCKILEELVSVAILAAGIVAALWFRLGLFPLVAGILILSKAILRKIPCKETNLGVQ